MEYVIQSTNRGGDGPGPFFFSFSFFPPPPPSFFFFSLCTAGLDAIEMGRYAPPPAPQALFFLFLSLCPSRSFPPFFEPFFLPPPQVYPFPSPSRFAEQLGPGQSPFFFFSLPPLSPFVLTFSPCASFTAREKKARKLPTPRSPSFLLRPSSLFFPQALPKTLFAADPGGLFFFFFFPPFFLALCPFFLFSGDHQKAKKKAANGPPLFYFFFPHSPLFLPSSFAVRQKE